jgi:hypothetical protein
MSADCFCARERREFTLGTIALLVAATVWSIASTCYRYDDGDLLWQVPMVLHIMNPELLKHDPLITEVAVRYQSLSFYSLAACTHFASLPSVFAVFFVIVRAATIFAFYRLAYVCTASRASALVATFLLTAVGGSYQYLTSVPVPEAYLVPRSVALPFVLMAMASMVRETHEWSALWLSLTFLIHPVTGVDLTGVYFVYHLVAFRQLNWRPFLRACVAIACFIGSFTVFTTRFGLPEMFLTSDWRALVDRYVPGECIFLFPYAFSSSMTRFWVLMIGGVLLVAITRPAPLVSPFCRFLVAGFAGILVHCLTVDWLGIVLFVQAVPARATVACLVMAIIVQGACVVFLWDRGTLLTRGVACLLFLDLFLGLRFPIAIFAIAILVTYWHRKNQPDKPGPASTWRGAILPAVAAFTLLAIASVLFGSLSERMAAIRNGTSREFQGVQDLANLGMRRGRDGINQIETQRWIREHSRVDDVIFAPVGTESNAGVTSVSRKIGNGASEKSVRPVDKYKEGKGWQLFSERACTFHGSLYTYVHLSRSFAMRYKSFVERLPRGPEASWNDMIRFAAGEGADWIVIDERAYPRRKGDPMPVFSAGAYHVVRPFSP